MAEMDDENIPQEVTDNIARSVGEEPVAVSQKQPSYKLMTAAKIPVSKSRGKFWKARIKQAQQKMKEYKDAWEEAFAYYENDQSPHRTDSGNGVANQRKSTRISDTSKETENIVFSNIAALVPRIYSQNPGVEITANAQGNDAMEDFAAMCERLLNVLSTTKYAPGINLKSKAKKGIVCALLANIAWAKVTWTEQKDSNQQAMLDLQELAKKLEEAKTPKEIEEVEGEIAAIEAKFDVLRAAGPDVKILYPGRVVVDVDCEEHDFCDKNWLAEMDFLPTNYLKACFTQKDEQGKDVLIFEPTHVVKAGSGGSEGDDTDIDNFSIFDTSSNGKDYGYDDEESYNKAKRTKVWWVWDKITQRVELYMDSDWSWPLWVSQDPYKLDCFFPYAPLSFVIPARGAFAKGEVSYYLDQQDAVNQINEENRLARQWAKWNVFYNSNMIDQKTFEQVMEGGQSRGGYGVALPDGVKIQDAIYSVVPPSMQFAQLFDKTSKYAAIDRIASVNDIARGQQFKTNTTNGAIEQYNQSSGLRIDDKIDALEDWLNDIMWMVLQLCIMYMPKEQVTYLIGDVGAKWQNLLNVEIRQMVSLRIQSGSTVKPSSDNKKREALDMMQVLGQFAQNPYALLLAIKVGERAFDQLNTMNRDDWKMLYASMQQMMMGPQTSEGAGGGGDQDIEQLVASLSPEQQQAVAQLIESGADPLQAYEQVTGKKPSVGGKAQEAKK